MNAFVKTENGLFKVFRHGNEWEIIGPQFQRWFSVWQHDVSGSLRRALDVIPGDNRSIEIISYSQGA